MSSIYVGGFVLLNVVELVMFADASMVYICIAYEEILHLVDV